MRRNGFERSFRLNKDLDEQDKLATWAEFFDYQCQDYEKAASLVKEYKSGNGLWL